MNATPVGGFGSGPMRVATVLYLLLTESRLFDSSQGISLDPRDALSRPLGL